MSTGVKTKKLGLCCFPSLLGTGAEPDVVHKFLAIQAISVASCSLLRRFSKNILDWVVFSLSFWGNFSPRSRSDRGEDIEILLRGFPALRGKDQPMLLPHVAKFIDILFQNYFTQPVLFVQTLKA